MRSHCDLNHTRYCALVDSCSAEGFVLNIHAPVPSRKEINEECRDLEDTALHSLSLGVLPYKEKSGQQKQKLPAQNKLDEEIKGVDSHVWELIRSLTSRGKQARTKTAVATSRSRHLPNFFLSSGPWHIHATYLPSQ